MNSNYEKKTLYFTEALLEKYLNWGCHTVLSKTEVSENPEDWLFNGDLKIILRVN